MGRGVAVLYVTDPSAVEVAELKPHLGGAPLLLVTSAFTREELYDWESVIQDRARSRSLHGAFNVGFVTVDWEESGAFCSDAPYLLIELYPDSHDADLATLLAGIPPELVVVRLVDAFPTDF